MEQTMNSQADTFSPLERRSVGMDKVIMRVKKGAIIRLPQAATGCRLSCLSGVLWLTRKNDPEDYIITADSALVVEHYEHSVIEAITDCVVCIVPTTEVRLNDHP
jgi:hypothetical protein